MDGTLLFENYFNHRFCLYVHTLYTTTDYWRVFVSEKNLWTEGNSKRD